MSEAGARRRRRVWATTTEAATKPTPVAPKSAAQSICRHTSGLQFASVGNASTVGDENGASVGPASAWPPVNHLTGAPQSEAFQSLVRLGPIASSAAAPTN